MKLLNNILSEIDYYEKKHVDYSGCDGEYNEILSEVCEDIRKIMKRIVKE